MHLLARMTFGGTLLGVLWSILYTLILSASGIHVPLIHAIGYGALLGTLLGTVNAGVLVFMEGTTQISRRTMTISTVIMVILLTVPLWLLSSTIAHFIVSITLVSLGAVCMTNFVVNREATSKRESQSLE